MGAFRVNLDSLIGTDTPIGGRLIIERLPNKRGSMYKAKCIGFPDAPCGFTNDIQGRVLLAGKRLWCNTCSKRKRRETLANTLVGAEFSRARRRHAAKVKP